MKQLKGIVRLARPIITAVVFFLSLQTIKAQQDIQYPVKPTVIEALHLSVSTNKTTNLLFPYSIKGVDRGSGDILVQKALGTENVLQVKAARDSFDQTNLSVITADGWLYSFLIDYSKAPAELNFNFHAGQPVLFTDSAMTEKQILDYTREVLDQKNNLHGVKDRSFEVVLKMTGIYVRNDKMFFKFKMKNHSNIDYDIEQIRFFIRDEKRVKRTASQEIEMKPAFIYQLPNSIKGETTLTCIIVLPRFTIPDKKFFTVEMAEKNGGRFLHLIIHNKALMKSQVLN